MKFKNMLFVVDLNLAAILPPIVSRIISNACEVYHIMHTKQSKGESA